MDGLESLLKHGFKTCFILRGLPGRGKTTLAYKLKAYLESLSYSTEISAADDFLVNEVTGVYEYNIEKVGYAHIMCTKKLVEAMGRGVDAVIQHNTNVQDWESVSLRSNAYALGYMVHFVEPEYAWSKERDVPDYFKNLHGVAREHIEDMRIKKSSIHLRYLAYWLKTKVLFDTIERSGYGTEVRTFFGDSITQLPEALHLTTDYVADVSETHLLEKAKSEILETTTLQVKAIFKNKECIGALVTGMNQEIPRYRMVTPKSNDKAPHLTFCTFEKIKSVHVGVFAQEFQELLERQSKLDWKTIIELKDYEAILFDPPLSIDSIYSGFFSISEWNQHRHITWKFDDFEEENVFFELICKKTTKLVQKNVPSDVSPDGKEGWVLADLSSSLGGPVEDEMFDNDAFLRANLTRGLTYLVNGNGQARRILAGLAKFTGMEDEQEEPLSQNQKIDSQFQKKCSVGCASRYFTKPLSACKDVTILVTEKANGELGHILLMLNDAGKVLVVAGSKNVHMLFRYEHPEDLDYYSEDRYKFAREISRTFLQQYKFQDHKTQEFIKFMIDSKYIACYEYEDPAHQHIVPLYKKQLKFFAFTSLDRLFCAMQPQKALIFMSNLGFTCVDSHMIEQGEVESTKEKILFDTRPIEGAVLYYMDGKEVIGLQKCKNAAYILSRAIRQKVISFAMSLEKSLSAFNPEELKRKTFQIMKIQDVDERTRMLSRVIDLLWINFEKRLKGLFGNYTRKIEKRLNDFSGSYYLPVSQDSLTLWSVAGAGMISHIAVEFKKDMELIVNSWKNRNVKIDEPYDDLCVRAQLLSQSYNAQMMRDQWPLKWKTNLEKYEVSTLPNDAITLRI